MPKKLEGGIFSRHTKRADGSMGYVEFKEGHEPSERFPSVTKEGEEKAREIARQEFVKMIDNSAEDAVIFIGGSSEEDRTKATAEIIGEELAEWYKNEDAIIVYTKSDIDQLQTRAKEEQSNILGEVQSIVEDNPTKKLIFTFPLYIKEFSLRPHHREKDTGEHTPYMQELLKQTNFQETEGALEWFRNKGKIMKDGKTLQVPSPQQIAEDHICGINRLQEFARRFIGDRPLEVGIVGHGWQLDALAVYLANNGKVTVEAFEKLFNGEAMHQPETGRFIVAENKAVFHYRGKDYDISRELLQ